MSVWQTTKDMSYKKRWVRLSEGDRMHIRDALKAQIKELGNPNDMFYNTVGRVAMEHILAQLLKKFED